MKKVIAWLLVLALTAAVSIGATLAYLTDTDEDVNVMTLGKVKIDQLEYERIDTETKDEDAEVQAFHDNKPLYPGVYDDGFDFGTDDSYVNWDQIGKEDYTSGIWDPSKINNEVDKMVFVKNKGDYDAYVRSVFAFEAGKYTSLDEFRKMVHLNLNETDWSWEWDLTPVVIGESTYFVATATYNKILAPGALTEISLSQIALDKTATNADVEAFGETYQVLVKTQAIQADGFDDPDAALDEGFGDAIPFENDSPIKGIDLRRALHHYEGDLSNTITTKVTNVIFGLNKDHTDITESYTGTLVDVEQDVPVYAYYVPNDSNYDVYFLADDVVYSPKDSSSLYQGMSALKAVDTTNYDVSRVQTMQKMFRDCAKLTTLDTTDWDTSKVTNTVQTFYNCGALQQIPGLEQWDTGAVTNMKAMFRQCGVKGDLDLTAWDVSAVTDMTQMFYKCPNLGSFDADGWDTGACTGMSYMFTANSSLRSVEASGWDTSEVTNMYAMFANDPMLTSVDATGWTNSKVTTAESMFFHDVALTTVKGSGGWSFDSVTTLQCMFEGCSSLPELDVTNWGLSNAQTLTSLFAWCPKLVTLHGEENWDTHNVTSTLQMFVDCYELTALDTGNWDFSNNTAAWNMFAACYKLGSLDVSNWDMSKVKDFNNMFASDNQNAGDMALKELIGIENWNVQSAENMSSMFYGCGQLTELDLSGWNMPNLATVNHMFADCYKLETLDLSGWQTPSLITLDAMFNNCEALKMIDMSSFDTSNVKEFSQLFEACYSLEQIYGMENWDTSKACTFSEMFSGCRSLKELDLSSFDTSAAYDNYIDMNHSTSHAFLLMFSGMNSLEKVILSDKISFLGNGNVAESRRFTLPTPAAIEGADGKWYDLDTGVGYLPSEIPEKTAATYVAVPPATP